MRQARTDFHVGMRETGWVLAVSMLFVGWVTWSNTPETRHTAVVIVLSWFAVMLFVAYGVAAQRRVRMMQEQRLEDLREQVEENKLRIHELKLGKKILDAMGELGPGGFEIARWRGMRDAYMIVVGGDGDEDWIHGHAARDD